MPLSAEAVKQLPDDPSREGLVFKHLPDASYTSKLLKRWTQTAGLRKHVTFHTRRHTFATTVTLSQKIPIETVSKMLGHTSLSTTQIYAKVVDTKISEDMAALRSQYEIKANKPNQIVNP